MKRTQNLLTMLKSAILLVIAMPVAMAFAGALSVDATAVPFVDEPDSVTVDLELAEELVVVLGADGVGLGDVIVPRPEFAADVADDTPFERAPTITMLNRSDIIEDVHSGVVYLHDSADLEGVTASYVDRLEELGFEVSNDGPVVHATNGELTYRLVIGLDSFEDEHAVRVYIGR